MPPRWQRTTAPESRATVPSRPVPTIGASATQQRNRLALHVRTHQSAVGVVVLEEGNERRGHRHQLLRADVHVVDAIALDGDEVAAGAGDHPVVPEDSLVVGALVRLRDDVLLLFPGGEVEGLGLGLDQPLAGLLQARILARGGRPR